jgi:hypothetical protein
MTIDSALSKGLEPLVVFAGAGCADGVAVLFHVGVARRGGRFAGYGMANDRLGRGVARGGRSRNGQGRSDEEDSKERCRKCACESHGRPRMGCGDFYAAMPLVGFAR